jgi:hypothetical protein
MTRKYFLSFLLMTLSSAGFAGANTAWAVPTQVDLTYAGIMVYGSFGNPGGCAVTDRFFVPANAGQYKEIYATLMTALAAGKQVSVYVDACSPVGWYAAPAVTFNYMITAGIIYMRS